MNHVLTDMIRNINKFRATLAETRMKAENSEEKVMSNLLAISKMMEELRDKTWHMDTCAKNNPVFYGIKEDVGSDNSESTVKEVSKDKTLTKYTTENITGDPLIAGNVM